MAKSGIRKMFERIVAIIDPTMMPASATPMGSPMASTEPNATTRITMAKARPSASDSGSSNSPKAAPPSSTCTPSISGKSSCSGSGDRPASAQSVPGTSSEAKAILPASGPSVAICGSGVGS